MASNKAKDTAVVADRLPSGNGICLRDLYARYARGSIVVRIKE